VTPGDEARRLLRTHRWGVLATLSRKFDGHPYASAVNFVTDCEARPVLLLSDLAEHTRNLLADPRVSLVASDPSADAQAGARVTLLGIARMAQDSAPLRERYLRQFPEAEHYLGLGDFALYLIEPARARFIGGFGQIYWLGAEQLAPPTKFCDAEREMLARWNSERRDLLRALSGAGESEAVAIDCDGLDLHVRGETVRIMFDETVKDDADALAAVRRRIEGGSRA
jgi:heme oxygenase (biliverdin-IX-beta and delta-forming)